MTRSKMVQQIKPIWTRSGENVGEQATHLLVPNSAVHSCRNGSLAGLTEARRPLMRPAQLGDPRNTGVPCLRSTMSRFSHTICLPRLVASHQRLASNSRAVLHLIQSITPHATRTRLCGLPQLIGSAKKLLLQTEKLGPCAIKFRRLECLLYNIS